MIAVRPLCRYCGKPLAKLTVSHWITANDPDPPIDKAECQQRAGDRQVISVRYGGLWRGHEDIRKVRVYTTWDGESYESVYGAGFFDTQTCATHFANLHARDGRSTSVYVAALVKQSEQLKQAAIAAE
jgi:hypothetical protein